VRALVVLVLAAGCSPDARVQPDAGPCAPSGVELCGDQVDNDCDGQFDCRDPDCSGVGECPVCGAVSHPLGAAFPLPDGLAGGGPAGSYESTLHFTGFPEPLTFAKPQDLVAVCVVMEHSWLRDLEIELTAPTGQTVVLQEFLGRGGAEVFVGTPNDSDEIDPEPGEGKQYCWRPVSLRPPMLIYANQVAPEAQHLDLPAGDYATAKPVAALLGASFNGDWTLRITDLWQDDNGYIFSWAVAFEPSLVQDCSTPPIQ
jgi:subtilisin-like proprotein convertase family protein